MRSTRSKRAWFRGQMAEAPTDKALILALHHPIYSFDDHHSGSANMAREVEGAINASRRVPNLILTATSTTTRGSRSLSRPAPCRCS